MGFVSAVEDSIGEIAKFMSKNGAGKALPFNANQVAQSAAFNKLRGDASPIIREMEDAASEELKKALKNGEGVKAFSSAGFQSALNKMRAGDETSKALAEEFDKSLAGFTSKSGISGYAEYLGREDGKMGITNLVSGYFNDAQYGGTRIKTIAGAGAAVAIGGRYLSGGTLTRRNNGERDIAGVPFI